jgi:hypothetical protein
MLALPHWDGRSAAMVSPSSLPCADFFMALRLKNPDRIFEDIYFVVEGTLHQMYSSYPKVWWMNVFTEFHHA